MPLSFIYVCMQIIFSSLQMVALLSDINMLDLYCYLYILNLLLSLQIFFFLFYIYWLQSATYLGACNTWMGLGWNSKWGCCLAPVTKTSWYLASDTFNTCHRRSCCWHDAWFTWNIRPNKAVQFFSKARFWFACCCLPNNQGHPSCCDLRHWLFLGSWRP